MHLAADHRYFVDCPTLKISLKVKLRLKWIFFCFLQTKSVFTIGFFTNRPFLFAVIGSIVAQMAVIYFYPLQRVFDTEALSAWDIFSLVLISSSVFIVSEIRKFYLRRAERAFLRASASYGDEYV